MVSQPYRRGETASGVLESIAVRIHKLSDTDAFVVFDLDDAESAYGVTRLAPKILVDGAQLLARSTTYAFAAFGLTCSGASAGINAKPDQRDIAVGAFVEEITPLAAEGRFVTDPGVGLSEEDLALLRDYDPRPADLLTDGRIVDLTVAGALAAAGAVLGGLEGRRVRVDGATPVAEAARSAVTEAGAQLVEDADAEAAKEAGTDLLLAGGRAGSIDDEVAAGVTAKAVVPLAPVPVAAKAFATLSRAGSVYVPDFISVAAPLLAGFDPDGGDPIERVGALAGELAGEGTGMWMAAVARAEDFLRTWQDSLPFGRPLA
jgi:glutamate dehydrogenase/leucine dehydrogenase